ncbi:MAG TPA: Gfo/Idh/MocA family oxidoreductase [Armatimonadota bacterium]
MKILNIGVIGFGGRGGHVAQTAERASGGLLRTAAVYDPSDARFARGCADFHCQPRRYAGIREMLAQESLDVIIIGSPNEFHLANLHELSGQRIPIFVEKPLDSTWERICDVVRFARAYAAPVMVGHCMRYAPILQKAKALITEGAIGRVCSAHFVQYCHYGNGMFHNWRREMSRSGGMMIEKATHDIDVMQWLLDARPVSVFTSAKQMVYGGERDPTLRCRDCDERLTCPESTTNIMHRWVGNYTFDEIRHMDDLCPFARNIDVPDDEINLIQFDTGIHGSYSQVFYSPRSFHHRDYQIVGDRGAMDIDLGAEFGGKITLCPRYGTTGDRYEFTFDYQMRNHYNGDGAMTQHLYEVAAGTTAPHTTVAQAFLAEALGYASVKSAAEERLVRLAELVPDDLADTLTGTTFPPLAQHLAGAVLA